MLSFSNKYGTTKLPHQLIDRKTYTTIEIIGLRICVGLLDSLECHIVKSKIYNPQASNI